MPKAAEYHLIWRPERETYEVRAHRGQHLLSVAPDEPEWFAWLDAITSFRFHGQRGQLTVRKESRQRGEQYWYAYRRVGQKMAKKYLGRTTDLTIAHLEETAILLPEARTFSLHEVPLQVASDEMAQDGPHTRGGVDTPAVGADANTISPAKAREQRDPLLAIKLHVPRPRAQLVSRSHLVERLQQGMERPLTLVSAPAGFGKTTLLSQWLAQRGRPAAWLSLESEDNEPVRFLSYLLVALQTLDPRLGVAALALLHSPQPAPTDMVLTLLANDLARCEGEDFALVLDDYHVITDPSPHHHVMFLLEHLPPHMHLILATRADPPLPLSRLRARGQLAEVRADELRFETSEVRAFLHTVMGLDLSSEVIASLAHRTEGWIAGLQLAALALQGKADVSDFVTAFSGSHRYVLDYLSSEVLSRQSAPVQDFLLRTSILNRLCGALCEAVANQQDGLASGQKMLETLEQANLFVVPLDDERHWYRYHYLFAEVLQSHLQRTLPTLVSELHLRASAWYEQHKLLTEAIQHALAASDVERAADLLESIDIGSWAGHGEQIHWMLHWLERLPDALVRRRPNLCIAHAVALMFTNQLQQASARLQAAERSLESEIPVEQARFIRGYVAAIRGNMARYTGDLARCVALSQQALDVLPEGETTPRTLARVNVAHTYLVSGDVTALTERLVAAAVMPMRASGSLSGTLRSLTTLARLQVVQGRLRQAASTYEEAARIAPGQEGLQTLVGSPSYYFGMANLLYERNALEAAEQNLRRGMELIRLSLTVDAEVVTLGYTTLARLQMARAEYKQALTTLDTFTHLAEERPFAPFLIARGAAVRVQVELAQGNLGAATSWVEQSGISAEDDHLSYLREREYLTLARVRIAQGRHEASDRTAAGQTNHFLQDALHLLRRLLADAEAKARGSSVLELLLLQTLVFAAQGERNAAFATLARGLSLAEPEGYVRLFVDEGAPMLVLLRQAWTRGMTPQYVATLLAAFGEPVKGAAARPPSPPGSLIEPLTEREREVLQLLAEGASNREIAQRLILSTGTVKKYVYNICGKLGVQSRMQALVRARALHLL
jgi:LuxR family transcriptional regulator, maltose regulon positive regulatory protein